MEKPFPAYRGDAPYVFVCYAHVDNVHVYPEINWLHDQGVHIWYDEGISAGKNWRAEIGNSLLKAEHVLFFVSDGSLNSDHCNREINLALDEGKTVIPIYLEDVELTADLKIGLSRVQALRFDDGEYRRQMLEALGNSKAEEVTGGETAATKERASRRHESTGEKQPFKVVRWLAISLVAVLLLAGGWFFLEVRSAESAYSIAVIPFTSLDGNPATETAGRSIPAAILEALGQQHFPGAPEFKVGAQSIAYRLADSGSGLPEIADTLGVDYVLEGSIRRSGDLQILSVKLIRASDQQQVWSKTYENVPDSPNETRSVRHIASMAHLELTIDFSRRYLWLAALSQGVNEEAFGYLLEATHEYGLYQLGEEADQTIQLDYLKKAVEADPEDEIALGFLANLYINGIAGLNLIDRIDSAHLAIERALNINPDNPLNVLQLGQLQLHLDLDYRSAEATFERGIEIAPDFPWFRTQLGILAIREGRMTDARRYLRSASTQNASFEQTMFHSIHAGLLSILGEYEQALDQSAEALALAVGGRPRSVALLVHARSLVMLRKLDDARPFIEEAWAIDGHISPGRFVDLLVAIGETEWARRAQADAHAPRALGYLTLGEIDAAFETMRQKIEEHNAILITGLSAEWWDPLRDDPRFEDMLELLDSKVIHTAAYLNDLE